ncbi:MAG: 50S ribosomal protein L3 [Deltaproteobacteria bacterium]|nr:50S ribosomal protein L3 [Deltaproteobacteria bacterium]
MSKGLIGRKLGMTRLFQNEGNSVPVTVITAGPARIVQVKTLEKDGYSAVQLGFGLKRHSNRPEMGHCLKADMEGKAFEVLREFKTNNVEYVPGQVVTLEIFAPGEKISVTGTSKGRGYSGVMKRHGFGGGRATHGCLTPRSAGSIGCAADPSRVFPGKKMAGHYGNARRTVKNLQVVDIRPEYGVILVKGAVPGPNGGLVLLRKN